MRHCTSLKRKRPGFVGSAVFHKDNRQCPQRAIGVASVTEGSKTKQQRLKERRLIEAAANRLGIKELSDWYRVSRVDVELNGGKGLLGKGQTLPQLLIETYPDYAWDVLAFVDRIPLRDKTNITRALDQIEQKLAIRKPEDWYSVPMTHLVEMGFPRMSRGRFVELLEARYPNQTWDKSFMIRKFARQKILEKAVRTLFPNAEIKMNARKEAGILNPTTNEYLELDILLPELNLAFEFQEQHHFVATEYSYRPVEEIIQRDTTKRELATAKGLTLVSVPYWWDRTMESLVATIRKARPDLLTSWAGQTLGDPIPEQMPSHGNASIEGVGEPTTACFFTLSNVNPAKWWMFEKYDGVRGFWNPVKKAFYSRQGNQFTLPQFIIDSMPEDTFLDGELWFGRDNFQEAMKIANRTTESLIDWCKFKYMVFDIANHSGTYQERYQTLEGRLGTKSWPYIEIAKPEECRDILHLEIFFQDIVDKGGEGVILRDPSAPFQAGRCRGYLKHKKFRDAEAKIVGSIGSFQWECELPSGVRFVAAAGTTEFSKRWKPQAGDIVSFKHRGFMPTSGKPKLPSIYRMRTDISWQDVVKNWKEQKYTPTALPLKKSRAGRTAKGYFIQSDNRRGFLDAFARDMGFNPLQPEWWYTVTWNQLKNRKGGLSLCKRFPDLRELIAGSYPEVPFQWPGTSQPDESSAVSAPPPTRLVPDAAAPSSGLLSYLS